MIDFPALADALSLLSTSWEPWLVVIPGLIIGLVFGSIPGLQTSMAMAVLLPAPLSMDFLNAMLFLTSLFTGGLFGCGVSAILLNISGKYSAVGPTFAGFPMDRPGSHNPTP